MGWVGLDQILHPTHIGMGQENSTRIRSYMRLGWVGLKYGLGRVKHDWVGLG